MKHIALVPRGTGSGHNMRLYAIAQELIKQDNSSEITAFLESLNDTFSQLFNSISVKTVNVSQGDKNDYSKQIQIQKWYCLPEIASKYQRGLFA